MERGLVHLYCGDGKGKTSCAMGLALRAAGRGMRVVVAQFLKGADSGERRSLARLPGVECFYAPEGEHQAGVLSFRLPGRDCEEVGETLADRGFALRAGLHCAPLAHETAGTLDTGTVRASLSAFSREWEVDRFLRAVQAMAR